VRCTARTSSASGAASGSCSGSTPDRDTAPRPTRREIDPAAIDLIGRRGHEILATPRRYAATADDAEDAYQRGLEILLRKAPTTREAEIVPWLKTVVIRTFA
jgi:DNA-directed RNA polymerase specialized sigma24 family protein